MKYKYLFRGGDEQVEISTSEEQIYISNTKTNNKLVPLAPALFKPDKEKMNKCKLLLHKWPGLSEEERDEYLVMEFLKMGYKLFSKV